MNNNLKKILMMLAFIAVSVSVSAQTVTRSFKNVPLGTVLSELESLSEYVFMYKNEEIASAGAVTASFSNASIETVLNRILEKDFTYVVKGKIISISKVHPKDKTSRPATSQSQDLQETVHVSGTVLDDAGVPVVGATVYQKDRKSNGSITDINGHFNMNADKGSTVVVAFVGYDDVETVAANGLKLVMHESAQQLDEVVFVGYGTQKKESVVGAVSQIDNETIVNTGMTNVTQAITGKLSGVLAMQSSGQPGANDATIIVRGISSWNGSSPLVMVDGVERAFNTIDPNEIASISVLKDASATAVFGAKGANGVILVTTRSGVEGKPKMNLSVSHGFQFPSMMPEHQDAYDVATAYNISQMNSQIYGTMFTDKDLAQYRHPDSRINEIRYPDVDWYDVMLRNCAHSTDANFNISGGNRKARYFISMGYKNESSVFNVLNEDSRTGYHFNRFNYRINLDFNLTKTTILTYRVGGAISVKLAPGSSPIASMYSASTITYPAYYPAWLLEEIPDWDYPSASGERLVRADLSKTGSYYSTPYNKLSIPTYDESTGSNLYTDFLLKQDLSKITEGLSFNAKFSFSTNMSRISEKVDRSTVTYYLDWDFYDAGNINPWVSSISGNTVVEVAPYTATMGSVNGFSYVYYWETSINYDRSFNNHHITALALFNQKESRSASAFPYRNQGLVGRVTYDYKHKYLFEGNVGYTGSEQFAPANRYGLFPSLAFGYTISSEEWWKKALPWWSKLKLRYSNGYVGNDQTSQRWLYFSSYSKNGTYIFEDSAANTTARWEMAHKQDVGIEMGWLDNRLTATIDLFRENRKDMLIDPVVTSLVGASYKPVNKGKIKKHGYEIELAWEDKLSNGLKYEVNAMVSFNENRIEAYEEAAYLPDYQKKVNKPYGSQPNGESTVDSGYLTSVNDVHNYPSYSGQWTYVNIGSYKYLDYCLDGKLNSNDLHSVTGSKYPSEMGSLGGNVQYKGWELSWLFYANFGKWVDYNGAFEVDFVKSELHLSKSQADYWTPTNRNANHATLEWNGAAGHPMYSWAGMSGGVNTMMGLVGRTWRSSNYFSLRDLYLSKTFGTKSFKEKVGINSLSIFATANNLFFITNLIEGDPQVSSFTTGFYPLMKTVQIGFKVGL